MTTDETYSCSLCEESLKKAKKELNEDPKERLGQVQTLRNWINQEQWISVPTGGSLMFVLRCVPAFDCMFVCAYSGSRACVYLCSEAGRF